MIKVENLSFQYPGSKVQTIQNINFEVKTGEIFGFLGPNGAGKTTTQNLLIGLLHGYSGSIFIDNKSLADWDKSLYNHIGVCFELPNSYSKLTGKENLKFFASFYDSKVMDPIECLTMVGLEDAADKKVAEYSKGMKMRLNLARALMHNPKILFLDEPTTGQDPKYQYIIKKIIKSQREQGKTIFLTTHNMTDAQELCDRVALINQGQIILIENPLELAIREGKRLLEIGYRKNGSLIYQTFPMENLGSNSNFISFLQNESTTIETIHSKESNLEQVFLEKTGVTLS